jgi:hypothetical protein
MRTIPMQPGSEDIVVSGESALVISRSEKVLKETVDLLRQNGRVAGATNDFENVARVFDAAWLDMVVFGGMVPPDVKETLRSALREANPSLCFVQGMAGIPGLIVAQVEAAATPRPPRPRAVGYRRDARAVTIELDAPSPVSVTAFWGTAFVPPDPESTSEVIFEGSLDAGPHAVPLPVLVPTVASFVVVRVGEEVFPLPVGPMPRGTTLAPPPA